VAKLARRAEALEQEIRSHQQHLTAIIGSCVPNPEAASAALCGVTPSTHHLAKSPATASTAAPTAPSNTIVLTRLGRDQRTPTTPNTAPPKENSSSW
jgi:hypothetical protein